MTLKKIGCLLIFLGMCLPKLWAQSLHLSLLAETEEKTKILQMLDYQHTFSDYSSLQQEAQNIAINISHSGFLQSSLAALDRVNDSSFVAVYILGQKYEKAIISYDVDINKTLLKSIAQNITDSFFEIPVSELQASLSLLNQQLSQTGDPFATLQLVNITTASDILYADLKITRTFPRTIDNIIVKGYDKFPKSYIRHYLKLKIKHAFRLHTVKEKTQTLKNLNFASQIKEPEVLFTKDSTLLYLYLEKEKSNTFDGFLGFGTNADTDKIEFDGYLNLNLINNLNYGESFKLLYKSDENEQKTFDVTTQLPYLFRSPLGVALGLNIFKKDSSFVTTSQTAKVNYQINPKNLIAIGVQAKASTNLSDMPLAAIEDFEAQFFILEYGHISRQTFDRLFPINFRIDVSAGIGRRTIEQSDQSQNHFALNTFKIFNLNHRNSLYAGFNAALIDSEHYVENELFRFGGINSIRGFEENSLTANIYGVLNTEYRYRLTSELYVHSIIDLAYYQNKTLDVESKLFGLGFGFGMLTRAGLFNLNYSNGSSEGQNIKMENSKIHISLTTTF